jgi:excinuclease ABC subunit C
MLFDLNAVPDKPGVYMFLAENETILYAGKAKSLQKRVSTYFNKNSKDVKTTLMLAHAKNLKFIITANEVEALLLESNIIKTERPRYNILLKDSSGYPYIKVTNDEFPRIIYTRDTSEKSATYFGPFVGAGSIRQILFEVQKIFNLRSCLNSRFNRGKICIKYQIKLCSGPCEGLISKDAYNNAVSEAREFFKGNISLVLERFQEQMDFYSKKLMFEEAALMRDKINAVGNLFSKQTAQLTGFDKSIDVFIFHKFENISGVTQLFIRGGKLLSSKTIFLENYITKDTVESYIIQFYNNLRQFSDYIIYFADNIKIDEPLLLEGLHRLGCSNVKIKKRGVKKLIDFALKNASVQTELYLENLSKRTDILKRLLSIVRNDNCSIKNINTIECIDISHISGASTVGVSIAWADGVFIKKDYRKYKIKSAKNDDYASIYELMKRKVINIIESNENKADLYIVDGGPGQLNEAVRAFKEKGIKEVCFLAIAKGKANKSRKFSEAFSIEELYINGRKNSIILRRDDPLLLFVQRLRDEAHRYAISYTRQRLIKSIEDSPLKSFKGIGKKRLEKILLNFPDIYTKCDISPEHLSNICGIPLSIAEEVINYLHLSKS